MFTRGGSATWSFASKKDPRFTGSGTASGVFSANAAITAEVLAISKRLGVEPPDDIEMEAWKD